jgi:Zn-finger nucleic acid-binding protein
MMGQLHGCRQYICASCGGVVLGIAVLRQVASEFAQHLWTAEAAPSASSAHCPFCSREMTSRAVQTGSAALCQTCEVVWLDKDAVGSLPVDAPSEKTLASQTPHCDQCGAPLGNTLDGRCQYCGAAIHAPAQVILFPTEFPGEGEHRVRAGRGDLLSEVLHVLTESDL